jgi:hypothetical protein
VETSGEPYGGDARAGTEAVVICLAFASFGLLLWLVLGLASEIRRRRRRR